MPAPRRPAGEYRKKVTIETNVPVTDDNGQQIPHWDTIHCTPRAHVEHTGAREVHTNKRIKDDVTAIFYVRSTIKTRAIDPKTMRLKVNQDTFQIGGVFDADYYRCEVEIHCTKRT